MKLAVKSKTCRTSWFEGLSKDFEKYKFVYFMIIPVVIYYTLFHYGPMYGAIIAFKDFSPSKGILGSDWVGFDNFLNFFKSFYFWRVFKNTIILSSLQLIVGFPAPIILALLLNEVSSSKFKRTVQTVTYLPHFISLVVVCGMILDFTSSEGIINDIIAFFGGRRYPLLQDASNFRPIFIISGIWKNVGWSSIIYLATLSNLNPELYEAAKVDGAGRWKQMIHITLPGLMPTVIILFILKMGRIMGIGYQKVILLYNPSIYETADIISTFVYRRGLLEFDYSFSTAVGLFNSIINIMFIYVANTLSKKVSKQSLW